MPFDFWSQLVILADVFPARYHRLPDAPPYEPAPPPRSEKPAAKKEIHAAAREVHELHFKVWNDFALQLRRVLEPYSEIAAMVRDIIYNANCHFLKPLQEIGWKGRFV
ncbi:MAG: hypothetical protein HY820_12810 [Acidobacteria bacterium]|nr:hypothetical protein [Acidobacteriota bacterium]